MRPVVAALALALVAPTAAQAAPTVVVGPRADGTRLIAELSRPGQLCIDTDPADRSCGRVPLTPREAVVGSDEANVWGAVSDAVAAVEVVATDGTRERIDTQPPARPVPGVDAVRYFLAPTNVATRTELRLLAADGTLLAVVESDDAEFDQPSPAQLRPIARPRTHPKVDFVTYDRTRLAATPLDPARRETAPCYGVRVGRELALNSETCADPVSAQPFVANGFAQQCGAGIVATGITMPQISAVVAERGDGSLARAVRRAIPGDELGRSAFAVVLPETLALRRLRFLDAAGRRVGTLNLSMPPARFWCESIGATFGTFLSFGDLSRGGPLTVADGPAETLCVAFGPLDPNHADCALPPLDRDVWADVRRDGGGWTISGITLPEAATIVVRFADGEVVSTPTVKPIPGYSGRYAGVVPGFSLHRSGTSAPVRLAALDTRGRQLVRQSIGPPSSFRPRRLMPVRRVSRGGATLEIARVKYPGQPAYACVALPGTARTFPYRCLPASPDAVFAYADCRSRRIVLVTGRRDITVVDTQGRRQRLRGSVARIAVLGRRTGTVRLVIGKRREAFRLPAAGAQCGYEAFVVLP